MKKHRPTVRALMRHEGRFLLVKHNNQKPQNIGKWGTPGGRIESSDVDREEALRREMREEFGIEIEIAGFVGTFEYGERDHHVYMVSPTHTDFLVDGQEILAMRWLALEEIAEWHSLGRLHTGFELAAAELGTALFPSSQNGQ